MNADLTRLQWSPDNATRSERSLARVESVGGKVRFINEGAEEVVFVAKHRLRFSDEKLKRVRFVFRCTEAGNAGAVILVNGHPVISMNSVTLMPLAPPVSLEFRLRMKGKSTVFVEEASCVEERSTADLPDAEGGGADVLVISPAYPAPENLYLCGFVHARVKEYIRQGLKVDVASVAAANWCQSRYDIEGIRVFRAGHQELKRLIERRSYKTIVTHFVDEQLMQLFDGYIRNERLVFITHGPETLFEYLPNKTRPYFTPEQVPSPEEVQKYATKRRYLAKYAQKENVTWVFVSQWLKSYSEELLGLKFKNARVIHNLINEAIFPYREKTPELRKRILILRKFDNISQHSIDQCVLALRELSRRDCFQDLNVSIYGEGPMFDELLSPLRDFKNVTFHKTFLTHDQISQVHAEHGIALLPSRHDAHAVSMSEAASSGLVVVGSRVTSNPDFMNEAANHTLADPENPVELADILERLYNDPDEFLAISRRMSEEIRRRCGSQETVGREIALIQEKTREFDRTEAMPPARNAGTWKAAPVLTVGVPAYNVEKYIGKCLYTLLDHDQVAKLEVLVIDDGSKDGTTQIAQEYAKRFPNVRVVRQENGGHGRAINTALKEATGTYFRLVDGDDWVDSILFAEQIARLETETVDLVLTDSSYEYLDVAGLTPGVRYEALRPGNQYYVDDLTFGRYGFDVNGPLLPTSTYRTECLRKAGFKISEKLAYVDQEWNAYCLLAATTLRYYPLDIYRYLMGRQGQTVSREAWKKKYTDHTQVVLNLAEFASSETRLSPLRRRYLIERLIAPLVDTQIFLYDFVKDWNGLDGFLRRMQMYPDIFSASMKLVEKKSGDSKRILRKYKTQRLLTNVGYAPLHNAIVESEWVSGPITEGARKAKKLVKAVIPYGVVRLYNLRAR